MVNKAIKKKILSDPLAAFDQLSSGDQRRRDDVAELAARLVELKQSQQQYQLGCKKTSRQIGEAKRHGDDISTLKSTMQALSRQLGEIRQQQSQLETALLNHFENEADVEQTHNQENNSDTSFLETDSRYVDVAVAGEISVHRLDEKIQVTYRERWNAFVDEHPAGCIHHRMEWVDILKRSYGLRCLSFIALDSQDRIVGILPTVHLHSRLFGHLLCSMPYFQRGGAIALSEAIEQKLIQAANQQAKSLGIEHIEYRDSIERPRLPVQSHKVNMVLELPPETDTLWQNFSSKLRAQIRRPQRENTHVEIGHLELLDDFYTVYARNMRDLGSPVHGKQFIAEILRSFPQNSWLCVVYLRGEAVSAGFLLGHDTTMEIPLASTIRDVNHLSINMLLYWHVLQFAIRKRYQAFDFGRSTRDANTYRFKKQWGARAKPLYWHYWLNEGVAMPGLNPSNPKFALVIACWKRLPLFISNRLGPMIVKDIP